MPLDTVIDELGGLRGRFDRRSGRRRQALLKRGGTLPLDDVDLVEPWHELLLFLAAYPDTRDVHRLAERELKRLAAAVRTLAEQQSPRRRRFALDDSGIAQTTVTYEWSWEFAAWLARRFPRDVEVVWDGDGLGETADEFLSTLAESVERDGLLDGSLTTRQWVRRAHGRGRSTLGWIVDRLEDICPDDTQREHLFNALDLSMRWRLRAPLASRTLCRFPRRPIFCHEGEVVKSAPTLETLNAPIGPVRPLPVREARGLIDTGRAALAVRQRETDPLSYANDREVMLVRLERGIDVAIYGMAPGRRQPLESFFGYVAARNRVPIAYGGGWVFFDRCEIGVNIFDTFRGGESALLFLQIMRVYRQLFEAKRFTVDSFQFGYDNPEGLRSGAFWFYYRLGFRPVRAAEAALAAKHWAKMQADRRYRTSTAVLRKLVESKIELRVEPDVQPAPDIKRLGLAVTAWIGRRFRGDRTAARRWAVRRAEQYLRPALKRRPDDEREAFGRMSLLTALIDDLPRWSTAERSDLAAVMFAKGSPRERRYATLLQRHRRLRATLLKIAGPERTHSE